MEQPKILIVDDEPQNLQLMRQILGDKYQLAFATDGTKALAAAAKHQPDLVLLDIMMPDMDGYEVCRQLKANPALGTIPVIFVTAMSDVEDESKGFDMGGVDYITKPVSAPIVLRRVKTQLSLVSMAELEKTRLLIIQRLGRAAEYKDNETGRHVIRMSHYSRILAERLDKSEAWCNLILNAAPMHDVGKIGVPDGILLKPGPLDEDEWKIMRRHPQMGHDIIGEHDSPLLGMASEIALSHHEKWNGKGYPKGLLGEDIPLTGRIVALADVFDALTTKRPYKDPWPIDKTLDLLKREAGEHFDPHLVMLFLESLDDVLKIREQWMEP